MKKSYIFIIFLFLFLILGNDYYTRKLVSIHNISLIDITILGGIYYYILVSLLKNKYYNQRFVKSPLLFSILFFLLIDTAVGLFNKNEYISSDIRYILQYVLFAVLVSNEKNTFLKTNLVYKLLYLCAMLSTIIYIIFYIHPNGLVFEFYNNRPSLEDDIGRINGPSLMFWVPVFAYRIIKGKIMDRLHYFIEAFFLFLGIISIFINGSRMILTMVIISITLSFFFKIKQGKMFKKVANAYLFIIIMLGISIAVIGTDNERYSALIDPSQSTSFNYRLYTNDTVLKKITENPIIGEGLGAGYLFKLNKFSPAISNDITDNAWLTLFLKTNIASSILIVCLFLMLLITSFKHNKMFFVILVSLLFSSLISAHLFTKTEYAFLTIFIYYSLKERSLE